MANAARAGTESGMTSRQKMEKWDAPSMKADSKMSRAQLRRTRSLRSAAPGPARTSAPSSTRSMNRVRRTAASSSGPAPRGAGEEGLVSGRHVRCDVLQVVQELQEDPVAESEALQARGRASGHEVEVGEHGAAALLAADREDLGVRDLGVVLPEEAPDLSMVDTRPGWRGRPRSGGGGTLPRSGPRDGRRLLARADGLTGRPARRRPNRPLNSRLHAPSSPGSSRRLSVSGYSRPTRRARVDGDGPVEQQLKHVADPDVAEGLPQALHRQAGVERPGLPGEGDRGLEEGVPAEEAAVAVRPTQRAAPNACSRSRTLSRQARRSHWPSGSRSTSAASASMSRAAATRYRRSRARTGAQGGELGGVVAQSRPCSSRRAATRSARSGPSMRRGGRSRGSPDARGYAAGRGIHHPERRLE